MGKLNINNDLIKKLNNVLSIKQNDIQSTNSGPAPKWTSTADTDPPSPKLPPPPPPLPQKTPQPQPQEPRDRVRSRSTEPGSSQPGSPLSETDRRWERHLVPSHVLLSSRTRPTIIDVLVHSNLTKITAEGKGLSGRSVPSGRSGVDNRTYFLYNESGRRVRVWRRGP